LAGTVDVALNNVTAKGAAGGGGEFEIEESAGSECAEGGFVEGLLGEVGVEEGGVDIKGSEANAGDAEGVAFVEMGSEARGFNGDTTDSAAVGDADEDSCLLDDAGEHFLILRD
jgi:hypothetical protein